MLRKEDSNATINANLIVNKLEILLAILSLASVHCLSASGIVDVCKMINSFFDRRIIPDAHYLLDKIFFSQDGIKYYAICPKCNTYIQQFTKKPRILCQVCESEFNVKDPSYR